MGIVQLYKARKKAQTTADWTTLGHLKLQGGAI